MISDYERAKRKYNLSMMYLIFGVFTVCGSILITIGVLSSPNIGKDEVVSYLVTGIACLCVSALVMYKYLLTRRIIALQSLYMNPVVIVIETPLYFYNSDTRIPVAEPV